MRNSINNNRSNRFWSCLDRCRLVDLGFKGSKYTWTNKRYTKRQDLILERRDMCFATDEWIEMFPESTVTHLPRTHPLLLNIIIQYQNSHKKPFRFESMWCNDDIHNTSLLEI